MAKLMYTTITSLDGYLNDEHGDFEWGAPDEEVSRFINDLERGVGTYLLGRRMYETMVYWEDFEESDAEPYVAEFATMWRVASKVVFSRTLETVSSARTRIESTFDPTVVERMKQTSDHDLSVAGANLAGQAIVAGLVDEMHLFVTPLTLGGGTPAHPAHLRTRLELIDENRFTCGVVHLHYRMIS